MASMDEDEFMDYATPEEIIEHVGFEYRKLPLSNTFLNQVKKKEITNVTPSEDVLAQNKIMTRAMVKAEQEMYKKQSKENFTFRLVSEYFVKTRIMYPDMTLYIVPGVERYREKMMCDFYDGLEYTLMLTPYTNGRALFRFRQIDGLCLAFASIEEACMAAGKELNAILMSTMAGMNMYTPPHLSPELIKRKNNLCAELLEDAEYNFFFTAQVRVDFANPTKISKNDLKAVTYDSQEGVWFQVNVDIDEF